MKFLRKCFFAILIMLIVGAPIYAAGRIIIPNLLKDIIISNLPSGSKLSIGEIKEGYGGNYPLNL